jgi:hypothetical protein
MSPIDAAIEEIKSLAPGEKFSYKKIAEKYGVERTTLARRHQAKNQPRSVKNLQQRAVTPAQEQELERRSLCGGFPGSSTGTRINWS